MIVVKYPPIHTGEREIEVRYDEHGMCKVSRELMEILIASYRQNEQKGNAYQQGRRDTIEEFEREISSRKGYFEEYYPNDAVAIREANVYLEIAEQMKGESNEKR